MKYFLSFPENCWVAEDFPSALSSPSPHSILPLQSCSAHQAGAASMEQVALSRCCQCLTGWGDALQVGLET